jgi:transcriptional regulator with XRE-family HTH domain
MFADKLKTLREERGLSQSQLADKLFVTRQAVSKWERDAGMPDIPSLQKIADYFHVSIDDLTNEKPLPNRPVFRDPLSNKDESGLHYLWDILLSIGFGVSLSVAAVTAELATFSSSMAIFLGVIATLTSILAFGIPVGFFFYLHKRGCKGYWILAREIELFAFAFALISFVLSAFTSGQMMLLIVLVGLFFLAIYGIALSYDIRLFVSSPQEAKK